MAKKQNSWMRRVSAYAKENGVSTKTAMEALKKQRLEAERLAKKTIEPLTPTTSKWEQKEVIQPGENEVLTEEDFKDLIEPEVLTEGDYQLTDEDLEELLKAAEEVELEETKATAAPTLPKKEKSFWSKWSKLNPFSW